MCSTAKNKVSCLTICHGWFSLNNDHKAFSTNTYLTACSNNLPVDQIRTSVLEVGRGTQHPLLYRVHNFTFSIITLCPEGHFFSLVLVLSWGTQIETEGSHGLSQQTCSVNTQCKNTSKYFTRSDLKHRTFDGLPKNSLTESVAELEKSLDHPVFRRCFY